MKIDRKQVITMFQIYTENYDMEDAKIRLKYEHTYRVASLCERIAESINLSDEEKDLAWLLGMLHDIGRFEQLHRYGTFTDAISINHAEFGADLLFGRKGEDALIRSFVLDASEDRLIETAVRHHSDYRIPENLDERTKQFCNLLRDADKIDIFRVNIEFSLEEIYNCTTDDLRSCDITPEVLNCVKEHHAVLRSLKKTTMDNVVGQISLMFELVYPRSVEIVRDQGYLDKLINVTSDNYETQKSLDWIKAEVTHYMATI
ncbi:MAG: HD domain-containing protein [Lachnospiraceae bacterium]|nr:HD domain-containing protein [Lachnospiraceae bacterium]